MLRIAMRNLREHKLRTMLLGVAIVGGVAFVVASFVFTDSLSAAFDEVFESSNLGADIVVRSAEEAGSSSAEAFPLISADLSDDVSAVAGVASIRPNVQGFAVLVTEEGPAASGGPSFVISWPEGSTSLRLDGSAPEADGQIVVDGATAESRGYEVGDTIELAGASRAEEFEVVGTFSFGDTNLGLGTAFFAMDFDTAARFLSIEGSVTGFDVAVASDYQVASVLTEISEVLPEDAEAIDARQAAQEQADELQEGIGFFNTFLLVFAGISLLVGSFVVYNAFRVVVAQRSRELALLRLLGATRRQLVRSILAESVIVGLIASFVGVLTGVVLAIGIRALLGAFVGQLPDTGLSVVPRTIIVGLIVGIVTTVVSALVPAWRTTRITPIEALRDQPDLRMVKPWWAVVGGLLLAGALGLIVAGVVQAADNSALTGEVGPISLVAGGSLLAFAAMFVLARTIARPVLSVLGGRARSMSAMIAKENTRRAPRRTAVTASALMVGVGLVVMVAVLAQSVEDTLFDTLETTFTSDLIVQPSGFDPTAGIPVEIADEVAALDGVDQVARLNYITIGVPDGGTTLAIGVEPDTVEISFAYENVDGSFAELEENTVAIQQVEADNRGWSLGDTIELEIDSEPYRAEIVAIFDYEGELSDTQSFYLGYEEVARLQDRQLDGSLSVVYEEDRDPEEMRTAIESALEEFPTVQVQDASDLAAQVRSALNAVVGLVAGLLLMSVVVAVVGIVLTLYLAVFERTRETGMLRAIGMTKKQIRRMIRFESILIAIFGTLLGVLLGVLSGWALSIGVAGSGVSFGIPWVWLVAALVGALITGVLAAIIPARSATRMDVLAAIAYE